MTDSATAASTAAGTGSTRARNLTLLLVASLTMMSGTTIAPSLPAIEARFADTENVALLARLVLTIPALFIALSAPLAGFIADRYGRRRLLLLAIVAYGFSGMSGLVVDSLFAILAGRALLGMAVAGTMTTGTALVGDYFTGAERDRFMGRQSAFIGVGGIVFLVGGGLLAEMHWRAPFAVYGVAFALLPAVLLWLYEPARGQRHGAGGAAAATGAPGWALAVFALFGLALLSMITFYVLPTQLPFFLQTMADDTPSRTGLAMGTLTLVMAVASLGFARVRNRLGVAPTLGLGLGLLAAGIALVGAAHSYLAVVAAMAVAGVGMGISMPNLMAAALAIAPVAVRGRVAGGLTASFFIGQFVSPFLSQPLVGAFDFATMFTIVAAVLGAVAAATAAVGLRSARAA